MSQDQPRRATDEESQGFKYGDVFDVKGDLAGQTIAQTDVAMMQAAESRVLGRGQTIKGGPAAVMQSASIQNERAGVVGHDTASDARVIRGVNVTEKNVPGGRVITEYVVGQPVGQFMETDAPKQRVPEAKKITIGEALEAAVSTSGDKPVEKSDAAAIQAVELRATDYYFQQPHGIAAKALAGADVNTREMREEDKMKIRDVLSNATAKLPADKAVDRDDAARIVGAEIHNKPDMTATAGGVGATVAAAARINQERQ